MRCPFTTLVKLHGHMYRFQCEIDAHLDHLNHRSFIGERETNEPDGLRWRKCNVAWANRPVDVLTSLNKILTQTSPS